MDYQTFILSLIALVFVFVVFRLLLALRLRKALLANRSIMRLDNFGLDIQSIVEASMKTQEAEDCVIPLGFWPIMPGDND